MGEMDKMTEITNPQHLDAVINELNARAAYATRQAEGQSIDNEMAASLARAAAISVEGEEMAVLWAAASNPRNRVYDFSGGVSDKTVDAAVDVLNRWHRMDSNDLARPYRIIICSPGGSVISGVKLYSTIAAIASQRTVITVASGICASMGTIIHQAGTTRLIEPGCSYLVHDVSGGAEGSIGNMQDTMKWMDKMNTMNHGLLAAKSKMTAEEIAEMSRRTDAWMMPDEVVERGFADKIGWATEVGE